jgi:hypothetical protein
MVGTVAIVVLFTLTALAIVLHAAYCEAGEDLPCKRARMREESSHTGMRGTPHQNSNR